MTCQAGGINLEKFSQRIRELRKKRGLTQKQMSELLKCTERHYQKIEYGQINIPALDLIFLADYFDVSLDYLVGRCENPQSHR